MSVLEFLMILPLIIFKSGFKNFKTIKNHLSSKSVGPIDLKFERDIP